MSEQRSQRFLPIYRIKPNPNQPRRYFDPKALQELSQSIKQQGVLQPLIVRKHPMLEGYFELVAGERRWRALQLAGETQAPSIITKLSDTEALEVALLENIQREDLTPIEEGQCYYELMQLHGLTQEELAKKLGKDRSTIANMVRLLALPKAIQQDLEMGRLSAGHARAVLSLSDPKEQLNLRERLLLNNWSVRETEKQVKLILEVRESRASQPSKKIGIDIDLNTELRSIEAELQRYLGTKMRIDHKPPFQGEIRLSYFSAKELDRLLALLRSAR
ncbi:MAG: chromosome partitioning protein ParB [Deltaproteobacteria bacterium]|nr:chromosome partitioning protein ParB [Deltaproteobacteria bacterium]